MELLVCPNIVEAQLFLNGQSMSEVPSFQVSELQVYSLGSILFATEVSSFDMEKA